MQISEEQAVAHRIGRGHLLQRAPSGEIEKATGRIGGVQAQVHSAAQLALWNRVENTGPDEVESALWERKTLIRTWTLRGTLHLICAQDAAVILRSLGTGVLARERRWLKRRGIAERDIRDILRHIRDILQRGPVTRADLADGLVQRCGEKMRPVVDNSWGGIMKIACMLGIACHGQRRGRQTTFTRPDICLPPPEDMPPEEALSRLSRKYLRAHGPAQVRDFAHWTGLPVLKCRAALRGLEDEVAQIQVGDRRALALADDVPVIAGRDPVHKEARFLPSFDVVHLTHKYKGDLIDEEHQGRVYGAGGWIRPSVLSGGRIIGTWSHSLRARAADITVQPFEPLAAVTAETVEAAAQRLKEFFKREISTRFSPP